MWTRKKDKISLMSHKIARLERDVDYERQTWKDHRQRAEDLWSTAFELGRAGAEPSGYPIPQDRYERAIANAAYQKGLAKFEAMRARILAGTPCDPGKKKP